ncbi:MAG: P1 family peptidase [Thermomicrobiales bacterium]
MTDARAAIDEPIRTSIGHFTDQSARTGCTVILFDRPAITAVDVRGGAPGTRETDLLAPGRLVRHADAILLTGGSAFGLAAADGVMRFLADGGRGVQTRAGRVPIVPSAVVYDLGVGSPIAPDAVAGRRACENAVPLSEVTRGRVGAGTGATTGKLIGTESVMLGGLGVGAWTWDGCLVTAVAVVNAFGKVMHGRCDDESHLAPLQAVFADGDPVEYGRESTTLAVVLVDAPVDYSTLVLCTVAAHDALARTIVPCHSVFDGDVAFAVALRNAGSVAPADALRIGTAAGIAVERAILDATTDD